MDIRNFLSLQPIPDTNVYKGTLVERELPEILVYLKLWGNNSRGLWAFHIFLGIFATFFSLLAATGFGGETLSRVFAFIASPPLFLFLLVSFSPLPSSSVSFFLFLFSLSFSFSSLSSVSCLRSHKMYPR